MKKLKRENECNKKINQFISKNGADRYHHLNYWVPCAYYIDHAHNSYTPQEFEKAKESKKIAHDSYKKEGTMTSVYRIYVNPHPDKSQ